MSAEAQRIGHGDTDIRLLPLIDHKVQITGRIRMTIVDRCRHKAVLHCQCRNDRFQCPLAPSRCPDMDFVLDTYGFIAAAPNAFFTASVSLASLSGVLVPCALI